MTLRFDESAYGQAYNQGEENRISNERMPLEALALLGQGVQNYQQGKLQKTKAEQDKKLYELQLAKAQAEKNATDQDNMTMLEMLSGNKQSSPVAPQSLLEKVEMPQGMGEAAIPMGQQPGMGDMRASPENFRRFQQGKLLAPQMDMSQPTVDMAAFNLPPEAANMTLGQIKNMGEAKKLFAAAGESDYYTPEQAAGIVKGDFSSFGGRIPKAAVGQSSLMGSRESNLNFRKGQEEERLDEKSKARYRNYLLDMEQRDPVIKEMNKQGIALGQVDDLLNMIRSGNTVAGGALGAKMARSMGEVGVFTDQDVTRYVQSGALGQGAADKLSKMIRGVPTEATLEEIQQIANVMQDTFQSKIQPRYDNYINSYAKIEGLPPEEFAQKLAMPYGKSNRTVAPTSSGGGLDPDKKARLEELRRKKANGTLGK